MICYIMIWAIIEVDHANGFLLEEVPKSIGMKYVPVKIKGYFNIEPKNNMEPKNGIWSSRKKKHKKG